MQTSQASISVGGETSKQSAQQSGAATVVTRVLLLKPLKRPPSTESAGAAKKAKQDGAASAATGTDWCSDCWARAQDACRGAHRLVGLATAQKKIAADLTAAERRLQQVKQRMRSLKEAVLSSAPVLLADVPYVVTEAPCYGRESECWSVGGGTVRIALASTAPLTAEDVEAVCEALEGLELEYDEDGGMPTAWVDMDIDGLESVLEKLPDQEGQKLQKGDLLLEAQGRLTVVGEREEDAKGKAGVMLLGRVDKYDDLNARSCGWGRSCKYARQGYHQNFGKGTTFEDVRLAE